MSPDIMAALAIAIAPTIAVIASSLINWRVASAARKLAISTHNIVNSQRTEMTQEIDDLKAQVLALKSIITKS